MGYKSVPEVKKAFGIEDWKNLGKEQIQSLLKTMPEMDKELMFKVIEQFPEFATFIRDAINSLRESVKDLSDANSKDTSEYLEVINKTQAILERELDKEDLDSDDKRHIINQIMELTETVSAMDKNNKRFLEKLIENKNQDLGVLVTGALAFVGIRMFVRK